MAFPTSLGSYQDNVDTILAAHINNIETKIGIDSSAVAASLDYLIKNTSSKLGAIASLAVTDGNIIVGDGANWAVESGATARTSLGLGTGDSPTFAGLTVNGSPSFNGNSNLTLTGLAHGITGIAPTNVYGTFANRGSGGGLEIYGLTSDDTSSCLLNGVSGAANPTQSVTVIRAGKKSGTSWQALAAGEIVFSLRNFTTDLLVVTGDGMFDFKALGYTATPTAGTGYVNIKIAGTTYKFLVST